MFYHVGGSLRRKIAGLIAKLIAKECSAMSELENQHGKHFAVESTSTSSTPDFAVATQPSYASTLFLGPDGLRPGWGFAFYVAMFYPLQRLAVELATSRDLGSSGLWSMMLEELFNLVAARDSGSDTGASRASPVETCTACPASKHSDDCSGSVRCGDLPGSAC